VTAKKAIRHAAEINALYAAVGALSVLLAVSLVAGRCAKGGA
jgi:hypothetical protein